MASLICGHCKKSLITPILKQELQMRSILVIFTETAHLHFDEIIDSLIAARVLQTKHHTLLTTQGDRTHFARKLWNLLLRLPPRKFMKHVEPLLEKCGFFQDQQHVHLKAHMCLRCAIEHMIPIEELADKLMIHGCLRSGEHRDAIKSGMVEISKWKVIFDSLQRQHSSPQVLKIFEEMMQEFEIPMPAELSHILQRGMICVCGDAENHLAAEQDGRTPAPIGTFCVSCQRLSRHRPNRNPEGLHADFSQPSDDKENDAEIRQRSCRSFRKGQMTKVRSFQREVMKPVTQKRKSD
ncbi:uncharacterized protein [Littorina saxatilis]